MTNDCKICEVTVYHNQALVTRRGKIRLEGGQQEIAIANLPLTVHTDSVTARCLGNAEVQLLAVRTERIFANESLQQKNHQILGKIRQLCDQKRHLEDQISSVQLQQDFIQSFSEKSVDRFTSNLTAEPLNFSEIQELLNFLGQTYQNYAQSISENEKQIIEIDKRLEALHQQLKQLQQPVSKQIHSSVSIVITLETAFPGDCELEISYLVSQVNWTPFYDLRNTSTSKRINLTCLAEIRQRTGEDWKEVNVTLSTAKPTLATQTPKLETWYITSTKVSACSQKYAQTDDFAELEALLAEENDTDKQQELLRVQKLVDRTTKLAGVVTFKLDKNYTILSDGTPHKVTVFNKNLPCFIEYVAIPRQMSFAFLEATVTNNTNGLTFLPGKANIFFDNALIGTTELENITPGQDFKLNFGIDRTLKIEQDLVERNIEIIGNYRRTTYGYKITVLNLKAKKIKLKLIVQLPVSRDEKVKVRLISANPEIHLGEMGQLEWLLNLRAKGKRQFKLEVYYQFSIEHSTEITVENLDI
ncbi:mucoidy inhibitor MuiA family protein [Phormidium sp. LEGE 05292]|uniref:mucoidy inhibitor MuiA family protein n=1 Tax=[Phormidium] sp. LEGE 05292 TaxID=767427 RepID=UPI001880901F|nr:mucoidy inhibitor MuiA family protein [Phormidium sp. LEGE 05292]MBE9226922.1 mucoidy inhibitor MuiA family protein [Phormidium sp. LEGE 05292]